MGRGVFDDEPRPSRTDAHVLGESLDDVSVRELDERIIRLRVEIERLEAARLAKLAASDHAASIFRS